MHMARPLNYNVQILRIYVMILGWPTLFSREELMLRRAINYNNNMYH